jgi:hypothetical protein
MTGVGVVVNPWAGKDIRRLHAPSGHSPDTAKVGIVRRMAIAALDAGAPRVVAARDGARIAERALRGLDRTELIDGPETGSYLDSRRGAGQLAELGCSPIVVLGGDGTCRDVAIGAPGVTLLPISTGTNNVFPRFVDGSSAGTAAGLVASGAIDVDGVARPAKLLHVEIHHADGTTVHDLALVDVALIDDVRTGARAVLRPGSVLAVVAAISSPASTGLSAIAGRVHPLGRHSSGAVVVKLGGSRRVHVPIVPGVIDEIGIASVDELRDGASVELLGPGVLAFDGERDRVLGPDATATITVRHDGPLVVDVDRVLHCAASRRLFDVIAPEADDGN